MRQRPAQNSLLDPHVEQIPAARVAIPRAPFGPDMRVSSAVATSLAMTASAVAGGSLLHRAAGGFVAVATPLRTGVALAAGAQLPRLGKIAVLGEAIVVGVVVYVGVLVALRELGLSDVAALRQALGRGAARRPAAHTS
jgi:stage V sporulation protein B